MGLGLSCILPANASGYGHPPISRCHLHRCGVPMRKTTNDLVSERNTCLHRRQLPRRQTGSSVVRPMAASCLPGNLRLYSIVACYRLPRLSELTWALKKILVKRWCATAKFPDVPFSSTASRFLRSRRNGAGARSAGGDGKSTAVWAELICGNRLNFI